eukprot:TRINITY_DN1753_c0_g1_i3.p1 TRINITY_DN1753_c0_g1~~TRINITY_DN1753_c0_g1_i3.p1  ORF type:complete len:103 (-),score=12.42 TRINITY_DN1753_c0_g1_i3:294-602(-)
MMDNNGCHESKDFMSEPYHACGNSHGLHLIPGVFKWDWSSQVMDSFSIKVYTMNSGVVPIWRCTQSGNGGPLHTPSVVHRINLRRYPIGLVGMGVASKAWFV